MPANTGESIMQINRAAAFQGLLGGVVATALFLVGGCATTGASGPGREIIYVFNPISDAELALIKYPNLREELLDMVKRDQNARRGVRSAEDDPLEDAVALMTRIDKENTARLHEIVDEVGWPTKSGVGSDGTQAAWLLVQHADLDVAFQRRALKLMQDELIRDEVYAANVAYLTDRVLVNEGKEQEYGTQFHTVRGKPEPRPIRDAKHVDQRRKEVGLSTLAEYRKLMKT